MRVARDADAGRRRKKNKKVKKSKKSKKNKNSKKNRKSKKSMKSKKNKKSKKNRKNKRKNNKVKKEEKNKQKKNKNKKRTNNGSRAQERMVDGKCLECAATAMSRWMTQVANFNKQKTRAQKQSDIAEKKSAKQDVFAPVAKKLIDVGGGNKSALTCSGSSDSDGAKQLANLTTTLEECAMKINETCNPATFPKANMTLVEECSATIELFEAEAQKCLDLSKEDTAEGACTCWTGDVMKKLSEDVKSCKIAEVGAIAQGLKDCKAAFSECRKLEDASVASIGLCSQSAADLQAKATALQANKDAVGDVKAAIASAKSRRRHARAAASDCGGFLTLVIECN